MMDIGRCIIFSEKFFAFLNAAGQQMPSYNAVSTGL